MEGRLLVDQQKSIRRQHDVTDEGCDGVRGEHRHKHPGPAAGISNSFLPSDSFDGSIAKNNGISARRVKSSVTRL